MMKKKKKIYFWGRSDTKRCEVINGVERGRKLYLQNKGGEEIQRYN